MLLTTKLILLLLKIRALIVATPKPRLGYTDTRNGKQRVSPDRPHPTTAVPNPTPAAPKCPMIQPPAAKIPKDPKQRWSRLHLGRS
ncbi:hypothetical protein ON021_34095, partial [Microcoleus sp. HI-ES]|nr:hypothetical protein [Microcoleus sp. HI-ES]MCZ0904938.1 hypothetical protein [Microcoleus sp. HI-ES]